MALKFSQGVVNALAQGMGWGEILKNSVCVVYSGSQPASPELGATAGTELVRFTTNSGTLTAETRACCRIALGTGTMVAGDTVKLTLGDANNTMCTWTGYAGAANVGASSFANAVNSSWSFPDLQAVVAGTTVGPITYGASANAANEVFIIGPKNAANWINTLPANLTVSTAANCAFTINGAAANTATTFANATNGGGGNSANGLGVAAANGLALTYPANAGMVAKTGTWSGNATANGTAGWFRILCTPNYDANGTTNLNSTGTDATFIMRIDGTIGTSGADMIVSSANITANVAQTVTSFALTVPSS